MLLCCTGLFTGVLSTLEMQPHLEKLHFKADSYCSTMQAPRVLQTVMRKEARWIALDPCRVYNLQLNNADIQEMHVLLPETTLHQICRFRHSLIYLPLLQGGPPKLWLLLYPIEIKGKTPVELSRPDQTTSEFWYWMGSGLSWLSR